MVITLEQDSGYNPPWEVGPKMARVTGSHVRGAECLGQGT